MSSEISEKVTIYGIEISRDMKPDVNEVSVINSVWTKYDTDKNRTLDDNEWAKLVEDANRQNKKLEEIYSKKNIRLTRKYKKQLKQIEKESDKIDKEQVNIRQARYFDKLSEFLQSHENVIFKVLGEGETPPDSYELYDISSFGIGIDPKTGKSYKLGYIEGFEKLSKEEQEKLVNLINKSVESLEKLRELDEKRGDLSELYANCIHDVQLAEAGIIDETQNDKSRTKIRDNYYTKIRSDENPFWKQIQQLEKSIDSKHAQLMNLDDSEKDKKKALERELEQYYIQKDQLEQASLQWFVSGYEKKDDNSLSQFVSNVTGFSTENIEQQLAQLGTVSKEQNPNNMTDSVRQPKPDNPEGVTPNPSDNNLTDADIIPSVVRLSQKDKQELDKMNAVINPETLQPKSNITPTGNVSYSEDPSHNITGGNIGLGYSANGLNTNIGINVQNPVNGENSNPTTTTNASASYNGKKFNASGGFNLMNNNSSENLNGNTSFGYTNGGFGLSAATGFNINSMQIQSDENGETKTQVNHTSNADLGITYGKGSFNSRLQSRIEMNDERLQTINGSLDLQAGNFTAQSNLSLTAATESNKPNINFRNSLGYTNKGWNLSATNNYSHTGENESFDADLLATKTVGNSHITGSAKLTQTSQAFGLGGGTTIARRIDEHTVYALVPSVNTTYNTQAESITLSPKLNGGVLYKEGDKSASLILSESLSGSFYTDGQTPAFNNMLALSANAQSGHWGGSINFAHTVMSSQANLTNVNSNPEYTKKTAFGLGATYNDDWGNVGIGLSRTIGGDLPPETKLNVSASVNLGGNDKHKKPIEQSDSPTL